MRRPSRFAVVCSTLALLACQKTEMETAAPAKLEADSAAPVATTAVPDSAKVAPADSSGAKDSTMVNDSTVTISGDSAGAPPDTTKQP
jgi:hypothetical protein